MNFMPEGLLIKKNDSVTFQYRVVVHGGELSPDKVNGFYQDWTIDLQK
jgi:hypothetical protein